MVLFRHGRRGRQPVVGRTRSAVRSRKPPSRMQAIGSGCRHGEPWHIDCGTVRGPPHRSVASGPCADQALYRAKRAGRNRAETTAMLSTETDACGAKTRTHALLWWSGGARVSRIGPRKLRRTWHGSPPPPSRLRWPSFRCWLGATGLHRQWRARTRGHPPRAVILRPHDRR